MPWLSTDGLLPELSGLLPVTSPLEWLKSISPFVKIALLNSPVISVFLKFKITTSETLFEPADAIDCIL